MPIWVKCVFVLWAFTFVIDRFANMYKAELRKLLHTASISGHLPWYIWVYGLAVILCVVSVIPLTIWLIFLR